MESLFVILAIWLLAGPILFIILLMQLSRIRRRLEQVEQRDGVAWMGVKPQRDPPPDFAPPPQAEPAPQEFVPPEPAKETSPADKVEIAAQSHPEPEARFASQWFIWLGGLTIALGGGFLIKYSVDAGLLGPAQRIIAAIILGIALVAGGEWVRRNPRKIGAVALAGERIPAALTAAGLVTIFAALYGGHALYDLYSTVPAFTLLAATAIAGVMVSLLHGKYGAFIAGLGLLGAYVVPLLVSTDTPSSAALFTYIAVLNVATLSLLRWRGWAWLGWGVLAGAAIWPLLFLSATTLTLFDAEVMGLYALVSAIGIALIMGIGHGDLGVGGVRQWREAGVLPTIGIAYIAAAVAALLLIILMVQTDYALEPIYIALATFVIFAVLAARVGTLYGFALVGAAGVVGMLVLWPLTIEPVAVVANAPLFPLGSSFLVLIAALASIAAFALGYMKLWANRPGYWASITTIAPLAFFMAAYLKLHDFDHSFKWNWAAFGLFVLYNGLVRLVLREQDRPGAERAWAAIAVGITGALSLAISLTFEQAWLTVALAAQVPVLAWINSRLNLRILRVLAGLIAGAVLVRLVVNPEVSAYSMRELQPIWNWIWYGYGLPAISFALAARWFVRDGEETLSVRLMQVAALVLFVLMVTLEIRVFVNAHVWSWRSYSLAESSLDVIAWLTISLVLYWRYAKTSPPVVFWARRALLAYSAFHIVLFNLLAENPVLNPTPVGNWPLFNLLALAYLAPGLLAIGFTAVSLMRDQAARIAPVWLTAAAGFGLLFVYLSFEIRHLFHGSVLYEAKDTFFTQGELYAYSAAWLAVAAGMIAVGIWQNQRHVRMVALALLAIVVAKVFLVDMSELAGIFRVVSFLGLGVGLMGIGYAYQRFVVPPVQNPS